MQPWCSSFNLRGIIPSILVVLLLAAHAPGIRADAVDDYIKTRMEREHIPGLSLAVVRNGKIIKEKGYGYASLELKVPARPETVYELASTTKPLMATAVLLLVQDGKLALDDRISKFVENTPEPWKDITVRHLLSHTSGVKDYLSDLRKDFPHDAAPEQMAKAAMDAPLNFVPGAKWAYSNTGFVLLGMIVKRITGQTYDVSLHQRVFRPYGMTQTRRDTPDEMVPARTVGYLWFGGAFHNGEFLKYLMTNHGDRGILSTVHDLAKWDAVLSGTNLLTPATKTAMWTPVVQCDIRSSYIAEYGLGWFIKTFNGHRQISHPGGAPGAGAIISRYPDDGLTIILMANCQNAFMQALDLGVARHYISGLMTETSVRLGPAMLESCTGYYNAYGSQLLKVTREKSSLLLDDGGGVNNDFMPVSDSQFIAEEADRAFTVIRDAGHNVVRATLRFGKDDVAIQRIGPLASRVVPHSDPDPALTKQIQAALHAMALGGRQVEAAPQLAPGARRDYSRGPALELSGINGITYIATQGVAPLGIERHGEKVSRVLYYRFVANGAMRYVLVYLTANGLVADQDVTA